jgi:hypothetical protein
MSDDVKANTPPVNRVEADLVEPPEEHEVAAVAVTSPHGGGPK